MKTRLVKWGLIGVVLVILGYLWGQAQFELPASAPSQAIELEWTIPQIGDNGPVRQAAERLYARFGRSSTSEQGTAKGAAMVTQWQLRGMLHEPLNDFVLIEQGGQITRKKAGDLLPNGEKLLRIDQQGILVETLEGAVRVQLYPTP